MIIDTKLNIHDEVYFMHSNKVWVTEVSQVHTRTESNIYGAIVTKVYYDIARNPAGTQYTTSGFRESELFKTKAELLETL